MEVAKVSGPRYLDHARNGDVNEPNVLNQNTMTAAEESAWNHCVSVLLSKPILALEFSRLKMHVEAPTVVVPPSKRPEVGESSARFGRPFFF